MSLMNAIEESKWLDMRWRKEGVSKDHNTILSVGVNAYGCFMDGTKLAVASDISLLWGSPGLTS